MDPLNCQPSERYFCVTRVAAHLVFGTEADNIITMTAGGPYRSTDQTNLISTFYYLFVSFPNMTLKITNYAISSPPFILNFLSKFIYIPYAFQIVMAYLLYT